MRLSAVYRLFASALLACVASSIALSSQAHATEQSPLAPNCWPEISSSFEVLEYWLSPADHAIVTAGTPVAFSGRSEAPLTFVVASQRSLISTPDIDSGPGVASNPEPAPQTSYTYTFAASSGGSEPFSHRYTGSALRTLEHLVEAGDDVEIEISVKATDQFGNVSRAHETDPLHLAGSRVKRALSH